MEVEQQRQNNLIVKILSITGIIFMLCGLFILISPDLLINLIKLDLFTTRIFAGCLIFAGISDLVIAKVLFKNKKRGLSPYEDPKKAQELDSTSVKQ